MGRSTAVVHLNWSHILLKLALTGTGHSIIATRSFKSLFAYLASVNFGDFTGRGQVTISHSTLSCSC
jgi:hypothetical protein